VRDVTAHSSRPNACRLCSATLKRTFIDLGRSPLANSLLSPEDLGRGEVFYPLHVYVCDRCLLVQLPEFEHAEAIFGDYLYFSSYSDHWLRHGRDYAETATRRFGLSDRSRVVEVASNDGYLLQHFRQRGIGVLGVEPAANVAKVAQDKDIPTEVAFFGAATAQRLANGGTSADLMVANNVLAHVPDFHDFVAGFKILLKPRGTATFEFPHLLNLLKERQFDTIYHEHLSYLSLMVVERLFACQGLRVYDVERLPTHGGSLRLYTCHADAPFSRAEDVDRVVEAEHAAGLDRLEGYAGFAAAAADIKCDLMGFLIAARRDGRSVAGYGAPAKACTLLNYCGIGPELLPFTVDISPHKQGRYLPGVQIPIRPPEEIFANRPDFMLILPWNIKNEIIEKMAGIRTWGGKFVIANPALTVLP
jgi:SAM-dependent methyltransferase